jgi:pyruvate/2-oxoglutarate dehydrogenase complex dihydrolipoamide dehydrogenase (E3) component
VVTGEKTWIPLALRANRAGWAVADNVCGKQAQLDGIVGTGVFRVFDFEVARTGLSLTEAQKAGFEAVENSIQSSSQAHSYGDGHPIWVNLIGDKKSGRLLGAQIVGKEGAAHRINGPAVALHNRMTVAQYSQTDLAYAPPFGPTWDPTLTAANQLLKRL